MKRQVEQIADRLKRELIRADAETNHWRDSAIVDDLVHSALNRCLRALEALGLAGSQNRILSHVVWNAAREYLELGVLQRRAREKPRGYAGDYQMLQMICDEQQCDDPLGSSFDRFFQAQAAPQAVRNRTRIVADLIVAEARAAASGRCHVVSIGSGPAIDIASAAAALKQDLAALRVTLIDIDPAALEYADSRLDEVLPREQRQSIVFNLKRIQRSPKTLEQIAGADLIICTGLLDYFDAADAASFVAALRRCLRAGGCFLGFNFSPRNPSRTYMEWIGNWYLVYRDHGEMEELAAAAGFGADVEILSDPSGVNLYMLGRA